GFQPGVLYELIYRAKNPTVLGLGWAGERDLISFFKHSARGDDGTANPLFVAGRTPLAVVEGSSQSGRSIRTFIHLGFNEDEQGRIVFEGAYPHIGGGRLPMNSRFSQPGRAWGYTVDYLYPAYEFPFSYMPTHDPITGQTDGILMRCLKSNSCPKIFHVATALEICEGRHVRAAGAGELPQHSREQLSQRLSGRARQPDQPARGAVAAQGHAARRPRLRPAVQRAGRERDRDEGTAHRKLGPLRCARAA